MSPSSSEDTSPIKPTCLPEVIQHVNHIQTYELAGVGLSGVRETSISAATGDSLVCTTPVLSLSLLPGHLLPEAVCDSIQAEMVILSSGLDLPTIVGWAVIVQEKRDHPNMRAMGQGGRGDRDTLFFSSFLMDHHGRMWGLFLTWSVSITADVTMGQKGSTNSMKVSFLSGKCFSWSF